jgi:hypothetical protein
MPILAPTQIQNGTSQDLFNVSNTFGVGVYQCPIHVFTCIPQNITNSTLQIVANNYSQADVPLPLVALNVETIEEIPVPVIPLDCQRGVQLVSPFSTFGIDGTVTFTGYDNNKKQVINTVSFDSADTSVSSIKTFRYISSVVCSVDSLSGVKCYPTYLVGLPYFVPRKGFIFSCVFNGAPYAFSNITHGNPWRITPPNATTGDANGTVNLGSSAADQVVTVCYRVYGADSYLQAQLLSAGAALETNASPQVVIFANADENPIVDVPVLISFDETAFQYPSDMTAYNKLPTT